jgi:hypothetical protein
LTGISFERIQARCEFKFCRVCQIARFLRASFFTS